MKHCTWNEALNEIGRETGKPDAVYGIWWVAACAVGLAMWWGGYVLLTWLF